MKYCLYEEPGSKKQDYRDRFRSRLFSLRAASQIMEILYLVEFLYKVDGDSLPGFRDDGWTDDLSIF